MKTSSWRNRRGFAFAGTAVAAAAAMTVAGLAAPALARPSAPAAQAGTNARGPGYPPPKGIYKAFTNCPLNNPLMHEYGTGFGFVGCAAGLATGGSITLGTITTQVTEPVNVQFGFAFGAPGSTGYPVPAYPPLAGESAITKTKPDLIPESLTTALSCSTATDPTIQNICQTAETKGGVYNQVYALAQDAGNIQDFSLLSWTQPEKFQLINPLLGSNCYIGSDSNPVMLHPSLSVGPGGGLVEEHDPQPTVHPYAGVLALNGAVASATAFSAPGVLGCGPGGFADGPVDAALDASSGLPAASGNSLTLTGTFLIGQDNGLARGPVLDYANALLAAFQASTSGEHSIKRPITMRKAKHLLGK